jgi:hypothetical protein
MYCCWRLSYQEGMVGIQLSRGEGWDPVIKRGGLGSSYEEGRVGIQSSRGKGWDPVIKRGELGSSHQAGRVGIQSSREESWDPINRFNPATLVSISQTRTWISNVICRGPFLYSVKMRGDCSFCYY